MRFMVMHKTNADMEAGRRPPERLVTEMGALVQKALADGIFLDGAGLHASARRIRLTFEHGTPRVTKGPYIGGNELLAAFAMVEADSLDDAAALATRLGAALGDGEIEIGPVVEPWDLGLAPEPEGVPQRFLLLIKADRDFERGAPSPGLAKLQAELAGVAMSGAKLLPSSRGARLDTRGGKRTWTDGPFTESKEMIAGFAILELPTLDAAKQFAEAYVAILGENEIDIRVVA